MKLLFLVFTLFFLSPLACNSGSADSEGTQVPGDETEIGENGLADEPGGSLLTQNDGSEGAGTSGAGPVQTKPVARTGPCVKYPLDCKNDNELCGQKYLNCLLPKAGEPQSTQKILCEKEGEESLTLVVNTWSQPAGQNNLLCDFWENTPQEEALYIFATSQTKVCQNEMDKRKAQLSKTGYKCE